MFLSSMSEILDQIADFVDTCLGPLGSNGFGWSQLRDLIIQLVATLLLFIIIRVFFWKRITNIIEARRDAIDKELDEAKENNAKVRSLVAETQSKLDEAQEQIKNRLDKAEYDANLRRDEIIAEARAEAERRINNAEAQIAQEIQKKNNEIHEQIVEIAMMAAKQIIGHEVDQEKYLDLVNEIIEGAR